MSDSSDSSSYRSYRSGRYNDYELLSHSGETPKMARCKKGERRVKGECLRHSAISRIRSAKRHARIAKARTVKKKRFKCPKGFRQKPSGSGKCLPREREYARVGR